MAFWRISAFVSVIICLFFPYLQGHILGIYNACFSWNLMLHWRTVDRGSWHCPGGSGKAIPKKKKFKKSKWLSEEALQIAGKRREAKGKGEKERYSHLNAEFQRIARRDKKAFLSDQCKEIEFWKQQNGKD